MDVNGLRREAVVVPAGRARHAYEMIVARGVDPGLLEVDEEGREFRTRVFPIPARGGKTVWIRTVKFVEAGEVGVWPKGLGEPGKWQLSIATQGGKAGAFEPSQNGDQKERPQGVVSWTPDQEVIFQSGRGEVHLARRTDEPARAEIVEIWQDGTVTPDDQALALLRQVLAKLSPDRVRLRVFRQEVRSAREFLLEDGKVEELLEVMAAEPRWGMARPKILPWRSVKADAVVFLSDGEYVFGREGVSDTPCPLHVVDSGGGQSAWLRGTALASGGGWHAGGHLDSRMGVTVEEAQAVGEVLGEIFYLKPGGKGMKSPVAR